MDELKPEPVHDWSSHGSSAFMGAAMGMKAVVGNRPKTIRYSNAGIV
jgi:hypothetical protein